nr:unnamed protein product [Callosobruchus chinensis]
MRVCGGLKTVNTVYMQILFITIKPTEIVENSRQISLSCDLWQQPFEKPNLDPIDPPSHAPGAGGQQGQGSQPNIHPGCISSTGRGGGRGVVVAASPTSTHTAQLIGGAISPALFTSPSAPRITTPNRSSSISNRCSSNFACIE